MTKQKKNTDITTGKSLLDILFEETLGKQWAEEFEKKLIEELLNENSEEDQGN